MRTSSRAFATLLVGLALCVPALTATADTPATVDLVDGWYYRWGDSPVGEDGTLAWLKEPLDAEGWTKARGTDWGHGVPDDVRFAWARIQLPDVEWKTATLYVPHCVEAYEAYVGTERVAQNGEFAPGVNKYNFTAITIAPIGPEHAGKILSLRIYSSIKGNIGPHTQGDAITIGSGRGVVESIVRRSLEVTFFGLAAVFLGIISLLISIRRFRSHKFMPLALGMFSFFIGIFYLTLPPLATLVIENGVVRYYARILSWAIFPVWLYVFVETIILGNRIVRALWIVHLVYGMAWVAVDVSGASNASVFLGDLSNVVFSVTIFIMLIVAGRIAVKGDRDARVFLIGLMILGITGLNDLLQGIGLIPFWHWISPAGTAAFILVLVYISDNRFTERARLLKAYSHQLEEKSEQLEEYARTLEEKVTERTRDLDEKNRELGRTLDELRDAQEQLILREKMASLGNLVAGVAHEVNNPVGAIRSAADGTNRCISIVEGFLDRQKVDDPQFKKAVDILVENNEIIATASDRVTKIVRSLRNFSRLDEAEYQKADLHEGLDSTLTLVHHQMKNRIEVVREYGEIPAVDCYPNQLNQVFMNLLVNAAQAIEGEGRITIRTWREGDSVFVRISDTGKGIQRENIPRLFDPGFTTKGVGVGTGLGLSISYKIVSNHDGEIDVESEPGKGSSFTVRIPVEAKQEA